MTRNEAWFIKVGYREKIEEGVRVTGERKETREKKREKREAEMNHVFYVHHT